MKNLSYYQNLLIVGGSRRHVGKTTLICEIIKRLSVHYTIIGLKLTSVKSGDELFHGYHEKQLVEKYEIFEEKNLTGLKDTSKMLLAGAGKVYYIRSEDKFVKDAFQEFFMLVNEYEFIICESISLRKFVVPAVFLLIDVSGDHPRKSSFLELKPLADRIIFSDQTDIKAFSEDIDIENGRWMVK